MEMSVGKARRLQRCATKDGKFVMLAVDHRGSLQSALNQDAPESVTYAEMAGFKQELTAILAPAASGVLLDPVYGASEAILNQALGRDRGLLVTLEKDGYAGRPFARVSEILPGWSVAKTARMGADGVKLLLYYHPQAANAAAQEAFVAAVGEQCRQYEIPLLVEPIAFSLDPAGGELSSSEKRAVVVESARRLTPLGLDVLKAEFPLNVAEERDEAVWAAACAELSAASTVPWVLLSGGVSFAVFMRQTEVACRAGASGVLAGRAVWQEATRLAGAARTTFLRGEGRERLEQLAAIIGQFGRPWPELYPRLAESAGEGWYRSY